MTEDDARIWIERQFGIDAGATLADLIGLILDESDRQNLISPATKGVVWNRHLLDSAQLVLFAQRQVGRWLDIGSGAGFPGLVVACLRREETVLVEPRRRRADFLARAARDLALDHVSVIARRVEQVGEQAAIISARAVAGLGDLFDAAHQCVGPATIWLLPRGRSAAADLTNARKRWSGVFHVEHSLSEPSAGIVIATKVRRR